MIRILFEREIDFFLHYLSKQTTMSMHKIANGEGNDLLH